MDDSLTYIADLCSLQAGNEPWRNSGQSPDICLETDSRVSSMACEGDLVILGSEEGDVEAWNVIHQERLWQVNFHNQDESRKSSLWDSSLNIIVVSRLHFWHDTCSADLFLIIMMRSCLQLSCSATRRNCGNIYTASFTPHNSDAVDRCKQHHLQYPAYI